MAVAGAAGPLPAPLRPRPSRGAGRVRRRPDRAGDKKIQVIKEVRAPDEPGPQGSQGPGRRRPQEPSWRRSAKRTPTRRRPSWRRPAPPSSSSSSVVWPGWCPDPSLNSPTWGPKPGRGPLSLYQAGPNPSLLPHAGAPTPPGAVCSPGERDAAQGQVGTPRRVGVRRALLAHRSHNAARVRWSNRSA